MCLATALLTALDVEKKSRLGGAVEVQMGITMVMASISWHITPITMAYHGSIFTYNLFNWNCTSK